MNEDGCKNETQQKPTIRRISHLPPPPLTDYSPFMALEFDNSVQEYCFDRNNHLHQKDGNLNQRPVKHKTHVYTSVNVPFNKIYRSCKVVVNGDVATGKTCLVNRFGYDTYSNNYQTTIGVDFDLQKFNILGQQYLLQIWDTAGLERFKCITNSFYRGCQVALLVFDVTNLGSLANVLRWKDEMLTLSKTFEQLATEDAGPQSGDNSPLLFLVGTKCDLPLTEQNWVFVREQANKIAQLLRAELWFVSAQTGKNVPELFNRVAALAFNRAIQKEIHRIKFESSTIGASLKEKIMQQQKELWLQSSKFIKITRKKEGDEKRSKCLNVHCVIK